MEKIYEYLKKRVDYTKNSCDITLAHQVYGEICMARQLNAITHTEYMEWSHSIVYEFINKPALWQ